MASVRGERRHRLRHWRGLAELRIALEAGYRVQITKFAYVQPNLQWIINPGGTGNIPNALVLGAQMSVSF